MAKPFQPTPSAEATSKLTASTQPVGVPAAGNEELPPPPLTWPPPPRWYPNPNGSQTWRWFSGVQWTKRTRTTPWPPPRGWYPSPNRSPTWRWFDGVEWTNHTSKPSFEQQPRAKSSRSWGTNWRYGAGWWMAVLIVLVTAAGFFGATPTHVDEWGCPKELTFNPLPLALLWSAAAVLAVIGVLLGIHERRKRDVWDKRIVIFGVIALAAVLTAAPGIFLMDFNSCWSAGLAPHLLTPATGHALS